MTLLLHFNWCLRLTANKARLTTNNHLRLYKLNFPQRAHWNWRLKLGVHSSYIFAPPMYRHISYTNINAHQTSMPRLNFCLQTYLRGKKFSEGVALRKKTLLRCTACYHPFNHFSTWLQKKSEVCCQLNGITNSSHAVLKVSDSCTTVLKCLEKSHCSGLFTNSPLLLFLD